MAVTAVAALLLGKSARTPDVRGLGESEYRIDGRDVDRYARVKRAADHDVRSVHRSERGAKVADRSDSSCTSASKPAQSTERPSPAGSHRERLIDPLYKSFVIVLVQSTQTLAAAPPLSANMCAQMLGAAPRCTRPALMRSRRHFEWRLRRPL
jgi:hypothetical protein